MMNKRLKRMGVFIVVAMIAMWVVMKMQALPSLKTLFKPKEVSIAVSPVAIKQIQALAQLITVAMYEEIVVDSNANDNKKINLPLLPEVTLLSSQKTLVLVGKITTHVGIDMQRISNSDVSGTKDSIHIILPAANVLDAIINPSDVTVFIEKGEWSNDAMIRLKTKMQTIAVADAKSRGLLAQSEAKAKEILTQFFLAAGCKKVVIEFQQNKKLPE